MKFSVGELLSQLHPEKAVSLPQLQKKLSLTSEEDKGCLDIALAALTRLGLVSNGEAGLIHNRPDNLIEACLRCSSKGFCFALREAGGEDIYIRDHQLNHAWNGDRVLVRITREGGRRRSPEGSVVCILERANPTLLATLEQREEGLQAIPLDDRLLTPLRLPEADGKHLGKEKEVVEIEVDRYPVAQRAAEGHVARCLSIAGGKKADLELLLTRHGMTRRGSPPRTNLKAPGLKVRENLTSLPTLLFSGWHCNNAPQLPALSLEAIEGGQRLWVHSQTVAERLPFDGNLDRWLRKHALAICTGDQWQPLLSPALTRAAGFSPGKSQEALSVALDLDSDGVLRHYRFCRTRITPDLEVSDRALAALASGTDDTRTVPDGLTSLKGHLPLLKSLLALLAQVRLRRLAGGSLELALPQPELEALGDLQCLGPEEHWQGWLAAAAVEQPMTAVREAVLLAGRALGRHCAALALPALFLNHEPPSPADLNEVVKVAAGMDVPLELGADGNAPAPAALAAAFATSERGQALHQQLRMIARPMVHSTKAGPNSLAGEAEAYAPWCVPGLHYTDLFNQQLLTTLLADGKDRPSVRQKTRIDIAADGCHGKVEWPLLTPAQLAPFKEALRTGLANRMTARSRIAIEVQRDRIHLSQARHAEALIGQTRSGVISGVQSYGFFVELPPTQVEGLVHVSSLKDDWYEYRSRQHRLLGRKNRRSYLLGDSVEVEIQKVDALRHQIDLVVVSSADAGNGDGTSVSPRAGDIPDPLTLEQREADPPFPPTGDTPGLSSGSEPFTLLQI
ncbi:MAG: RNB domain-containing ribonuclease [Aphanocapsa feldmannii 277cI]|uniref:RNB domain-containing ribonuclease n=1 Tax=Aphanocapsa feldmannii 277cI TaxID=2507554 RepID=A0A524RVN6_9CHRO|nr:MAG: RNB domain-containing ribonuclease [Aphanocapsa feldmannii 277cI]